jgi:hypothetical protein
MFIFQNKFGIKNNEKQIKIIYFFYFPNYKFIMTTPISQIICQKGPLVILTLMVLGLLFERIGVKGDVIEPFWGGIQFSSSARIDAQDAEGNSVANSNQQSLFLPPPTNPSPPGSLQTLTNPQSQCPVCPPCGKTATEEEPTIKKTPLAEQYSRSSCLQNDGIAGTFHAQNPKDSNIPLYRQGDSLDFVQVPGNYQSNPPPRFSNESIGATVRYNIPSSKNLAFDPKNPLPYAQMIERPKVKENFADGSFDYSKGPSQTAINQANKVQQNFGTAKVSDTIESQLPPVSMASCQAASGKGQAVSNAQPNISYDRFMVANISRQRAGSDYIRGDIPCIPQLPVLDKNSFVMFRPSNGPEVLNSGAMQALGATGGTFADTVALKFQNSGNSSNTGAGGVFAPLPTSALGQQGANPAALQKTLSAVTSSVAHQAKPKYSMALGDTTQSTYTSMQL